MPLFSSIKNLLNDLVKLVNRNGKNTAIDIAVTPIGRGSNFLEGDYKGANLIGTLSLCLSIV
jgi:hypothetical protein